VHVVHAYLLDVDEIRAVNGQSCNPQCHQTFTNITASIGLALAYDSDRYLHYPWSPHPCWFYSRYRPVRLPHLAYAAPFPPAQEGSNPHPRSNTNGSTG
jgi:hypothetical protein